MLDFVLNRTLQTTPTEWVFKERALGQRSQYSLTVNAASLMRVWCRGLTCETRSARSSRLAVVGFERRTACRYTSAIAEFTVFDSSSLCDATLLSLLMSFVAADAASAVSSSLSPSAGEASLISGSHFDKLSR